MAFRVCRQSWNDDDDNVCVCTYKYMFVLDYVPTPVLGFLRSIRQSVCLASLLVEESYRFMLSYYLLSSALFRLLSNNVFCVIYSQPGVADICSKREFFTEIHMIFISSHSLPYLHVL